MPIYEYYCSHCKKEFLYLFINKKEMHNVRCKFCQGTSVNRLLSSFSVHESEESRLGRFDPSRPRDDAFYKDSRNIGLWTKKKMNKLGIDLGSKMDEIVEKGRTGKILDDYQK